MNIRVLYFFDPYCGWCYGFAPTLSSFLKSIGHPQCDYITGGMITGEREGIMSPQMAEYILQAQPRLKEYTGAETGKAFTDQLRSGNFYFSSIIPSLAVQAAKKLIPTSVPEYSYALQQQHFLHGSDLQDDELYAALSNQFQVDAASWLDYMHSEENRRNMQEDFMFTANCGISGFPALVLQSGKQYYLLCRGYSPEKQLMSTFNSVMEELKQAG